MEFKKTGIISNKTLFKAAELVLPAYGSVWVREWCPSPEMTCSSQTRGLRRKVSWPKVEIWTKGYLGVLTLLRLQGSKIPLSVNFIELSAENGFSNMKIF